MITFSFLDKAQFGTWSHRLFDLLFVNMEEIAPGEFVYEEWFAAVSAGIAKPPRQIVLVENDGAFAGFFQYFVNQQLFMMEEIQLHPTLQGQGVVRKLYNWLLPQFPIAPEWVEAYNHPQNERSHAVLDRMGLKCVEVENGLRHYRGTYADLCQWLMMKGDKPMMDLDYQDMFNQLMPGFFDRAYIKGLTDVYEEMILPLADFDVNAVKLTCPETITFGYYKGDIEKMRQAVREVNEGWLENYNEGDRMYCAMDGEKVVSFCLLDDFGTYRGLKVGAPGCVGTIPSYRKQGIGLKMVQNATEILKQDGYDISYIHYTGVGPWYAHLGYETILKWSGKGFVD